MKELPTMYESIMVKLFWICVDFLEDASKFLGITYEELNIWVFIVIHPAITFVLFTLWRREKEKNEKISNSK
jgi:hypothetical protein